MDRRRRILKHEISRAEIASRKLPVVSSNSFAQLLDEVPDMVCLFMAPPIAYADAIGYSELQRQFIKAAEQSVFHRLPARFAYYNNIDGRRPYGATPKNEPDLGGICFIADNAVKSVIEFAEFTSAFKRQCRAASETRCLVGPSDTQILNEFERLGVHVSTREETLNNLTRENYGSRYATFTPDS